MCEPSSLNCLLLKGFKHVGILHIYIVYDKHVPKTFWRRQTWEIKTESNNETIIYNLSLNPESLLERFSENCFFSELLSKLIRVRNYSLFWKKKCFLRNNSKNSLWSIYEKINIKTSHLFFFFTKIFWFHKIPFSVRIFWINNSTQRFCL